MDPEWWENGVEKIEKEKKHLYQKWGSTQESQGTESMWNVLKKRSDVCGEAVAHPAQKCATPEDRHFVNGSGPLQVPDVNQSGGGEDSACGSYTCGSCSATFSSKYRLVRHVFVHISGVRPPPYVCRLCGDVFRTGGSLRLHLKRDRRLSGIRRIAPGNSLAPTVDGSEEKFTCNECGRSFKRSDTLLKHRLVHSEVRPSMWNVLKKRSGVCGEAVAHPAQKCATPEDRHFVNGSGPLQVPDVNRTGGGGGGGGGGEGSACGSYTCGSCSATFSSKYRLVRHVFVHIGGVRPPPHVCRLCGDVFHTGGSLRLHLKQGECAAVAGCSVADSAGDRRLSGTRRIAPGNSLTPTVDGSEEELYDTLSRHRRVHNEMRPYRCGDCGKTFKFRTCLVAHTRIHTGQKPYECDICGTSFGRSHILVEHRRQHSGDKPFKCNVCSATFTRAFALKDHARIHTGEKPYVCGNCGTTFRQACGLLNHRKLSASEMMPKCDDCNKSFEFDDLLKELVVMRTEERSYQCSNCGKSFVRPFELPTPYECSYCGKFFCFISTIRKHGVIHVKKKLYACVGCGNTYKRRDNLQRHQKTASCGNSFVRVDVAKKKAYECVDCGKSFDKARSLRRHQRKGSCKSNDGDKSLSS
ncbi:zinc finger protein 345-like [Schistocerca americana]|uniref:zinc finger protein 345-like n=1 Tax=Schistocerca americana TaxID=7009 RepID=UPI001F4FB105|nr:zinc finger protein 345-like [Schistocerca americana]